MITLHIDFVGAFFLTAGNLEQFIVPELNIANVQLSQSSRHKTLAGPVLQTLGSGGYVAIPENSITMTHVRDRNHHAEE